MKNNKRGITLIALIITVIVLLILAGTAIAIALNGGDIFGKASQARESWNNAVATEQEKIDDVWNILNTMTSGNNEGGETLTETVISKEVPTNHISEFVGKYADINGDGTIDGIIYVDLLVQAGTQGEWVDSDGAYTIPSTVTASNVKDYVIIDTAQLDARFDNTARDVVKLATTQTNSNPVDRFYVMGLDDITDGTNNTLYWYKNAWENMDDIPVTPGFEKGRENTADMKQKWLEGYYGETNSADLWGHIPTLPKAGANVTSSASDTLEYRWFIPSNGEWGAFANAFGITSSNYSNFGLGDCYWTSSQYQIREAWTMWFHEGYVCNMDMGSQLYVRACATF